MGARHTKDAIDVGSRGALEQPAIVDVGHSTLHRLRPTTGEDADGARVAKAQAQRSSCGGYFLRPKLHELDAATARADEPLALLSARLQGPKAKSVLFLKSVDVPFDDVDREGLEGERHSFSSRSYSDSISTPSDLSDNDVVRCRMCWRPAATAWKAPCAHICCKNCWLQWISESEKIGAPLQCPDCYGSLSAEQLQAVE